MNSKRVAAILGVLIVLVVTLYVFMSAPTHTTPLPVGGQSMLPTKKITIGRTEVTVEVATNLAQKSEGLSERVSLSEGEGMLFVFDPPAIDGFWMKDMRFSLDIIWADSQGTIVTIFQNLSPQTYPNVYKPSVPATYVLEVPAGFIAKQGVAIGDKIVL